MNSKAIATCICLCLSAVTVAAILKYSNQGVDANYTFSFDGEIIAKERISLSHNHKRRAEQYREIIQNVFALAEGGRTPQIELSISSDLAPDSELSAQAAEVNLTVSTTFSSITRFYFLILDDRIEMRHEGEPHSKEATTWGIDEATITKMAVRKLAVWFDHSFPQDAKHGLRGA